MLIFLFLYGSVCFSLQATSSHRSRQSGGPGRRHPSRTARDRRLRRAIFAAARRRRTSREGREARGEREEKEGTGESCVRVKREGAADDADGGVVLGAQPRVAASAHRPIDLHE